MFSFVQWDPKCGPTLLLKIFNLKKFESTLSEVVSTKITAFQGKYFFRKRFYYIPLFIITCM